MILTSCTTTSIQRENGLDGNVHGRHIEGLKHDLGHLFSVGLGVERSLSKKNWVLFRSNTKLIVESVMPDLLHVIPVAYYTMLNGIFQGKNTSLGLCFITYIGILLTHTNHDTSVSWPTNNTRKHSPGSIITSKTSLHDQCILNLLTSVDKGDKKIKIKTQIGNKK